MSRLARPGASHRKHAFFLAAHRAGPGVEKRRPSPVLGQAPQADGQLAGRELAGDELAAGRVDEEDYRRVRCGGPAGTFSWRPFDVVQAASRDRGQERSWPRAP